ncbi:MAG: SIMPL domain-containing protein [Flavisolibacter sp.]
MNKILFVLITIVISASTNAQTEKNPFPKTISVAGSAEMEIIPDEIYVQVDLKEYEKKGQPKTSIDKIRQEFLGKAKSIGLPDSAITIASYDGSNEDEAWEKRKKEKEELLASISYQVKLKSSDQLDALVNILDDNATENFAIIKTSHSKIIELRKQLKIQAIKAAKEKAKYLSEAIDEKIGSAISINENVENYTPAYENVFSNSMMVRNADKDESSVNFKKIRLKFDVYVTFALQ